MSIEHNNVSDTEAIRRFIKLMETRNHFRVELEVAPGGQHWNVKEEDMTKKT